jgi:hypothetical protein
VEKIISKVFLKFLSLFEGACKNFNIETKFAVYLKQPGITGYKSSFVLKGACLFPSTLGSTYSNWKLLKETISISSLNSLKKSEVGRLRNREIKEDDALKLKQGELIRGSLPLFNEKLFPNVENYFSLHVRKN